MKLIGIRISKPRKYSYKPVYENPVKETQENRLKESGFSDNQLGSELRMRMKLRMNREKLDKRIRKRLQTMSIVFTVHLLLFVLYYIFFK
jgi:hypothetical protein